MTGEAIDHAAIQQVCDLLAEQVCAAIRQHGLPVAEGVDAEGSTVYQFADGSHLVVPQQIILERVSDVD